MICFSGSKRTLTSYSSTGFSLAGLFGLGKLTSCAYILVDLKMKRAHIFCFSIVVCVEIFLELTVCFYLSISMLLNFPFASVTP